jgi:tripartite-type tricarboxylate transporter receptor subunit TctC
MIRRRTALALLPTVALPAAPSRAQAWPDRVVRLIVPFPPGASTDLTARLFAADLGAGFRQPVIVENKPGAAGAIGIEQVAKAPPDGYTLGVGGVGPLAILPIIDAKLPYDPARDLEVVAGLSKVDFVLVAKPGFGPSNVKELIAHAKAAPGKVTFSSAGVAGPQQLMIEHLALLADIKLFHVPFPGDSPAVAAVAAGDVDIALASATSALGLVKTGRLKALAAGTGRIAALPDLPSVAEQTGFADFMGYTWNILVAPKGMPAAIVTRLNEAVNHIAERREVIEKLQGLGLQTLPGSAARIAALVASDAAKYRRVVELTGLRRE